MIIHSILIEEDFKILSTTLKKYPKKYIATTTKTEKTKTIPKTIKRKYEEKIINAMKKPYNDRQKAINRLIKYFHREIKDFIQA